MVAWGHLLAQIRNEGSCGVTATDWRKRRSVQVWGDRFSRVPRSV
jgi:hypothetical protein